MDTQTRLMEVRRSVASVSLQRAAVRVSAQRRRGAEAEEAERELRIVGSQVVDERTPSACCFSPNGEEIATAGWSGLVNTWRLPGVELSHSFEGHTDRVNSVSYSSSGRLLSSSADCTLILWGDSSLTLKGHAARVNDAIFHVLEWLVLSVSHDQTLRLWDLTTAQTVLAQSGHCRPVYSLASHPDGSLVITGDLGGVGLVWDLRTGKAIMHLHGHLKQLLALSIAPNGYLVASGSDDNTVRLWDLRRHGLIYTIPAHEKLVSSVYCTDSHIYSGAYDGLLKAWRLPECTLEATVPHSNKVSGVAVSPDAGFIATTCFDKTLKLIERTERQT